MTGLFLCLYIISMIIVVVLLVILIKGGVKVGALCPKCYSVQENVSSYFLCECNYIGISKEN